MNHGLSVLSGKNHRLCDRALRTLGHRRDVRGAVSALECGGACCNMNTGVELFGVHPDTGDVVWGRSVALRGSPCLRATAFLFLEEEGASSALWTGMENNIFDQSGAAVGRGHTQLRCSNAPCRNELSLTTTLTQSLSLGSPFRRFLYVSSPRMRRARRMSRGRTVLRFA